jgi:hypothetical protein
MRHKLQKKYLNSFLLILSMLLLIGISFNSLIAQTTESASVNEDSNQSQDLSQINWDEEESSEEGGDNGLAGMNFDEEGESSEEDNDYQDKEIKAEEAREKIILIKGFLFFSLYILGGILTAYFTRDRKVAVQYPPELLILLHTFWPIAWIFLMFAGKKVR